MSEPRLVRPPSLRAFLDAGGDITTVDGWECLCESLLVAASSDLRERRRKARSLRRFAEAWLVGRRTWLDDSRLEDDSVDQDCVTRFLWEAECLEDPELAERFEAVLPAEKRAHILLMNVELLWPEEDDD